MHEERKTILIVEDSPAQMIPIKRLLEKEGLRALWAPDGEAAVFMAKHYHPCAIIMDLDLPKLNGMDASKRIKQDPSTKDIPILVLTAHPDSDSMFVGMSVGLVDFIPKDAFSNRVLIETLRQLNVLDSASVLEE